MSEWLIYQSLWDLQADNLYSQMGEDINTWMTYLNDIQYVIKKNLSIRNLNLLIIFIL